MKFNYNIELDKILSKIYEYKLYEIIKKNNILNINAKNIDIHLETLKNTKIYLGSDMDNFIISLVPDGKEGYLFRSEIAKYHNYSYPKLYDYAGNILKNVNVNKFAYQLWESHMNDMLVEDIRRRFSQANFQNYLDNNLESMLNDINLYIENSSKDNIITIPYKNNDNLVDIVKSMILNNKLDSSWAQLLIDMDKLRDDMIKNSIAFHIYSEFDKIEDELEYCLNKFCKYDTSSLYELLVNEKGFEYVENVGLVLK